MFKIGEIFEYVNNDEIRGWLNNYLNQKTEAKMIKNKNIFVYLVIFVDL